jgi:hypothetical protein
MNNGLFEVNNESDQRLDLSANTCYKFLYQSVLGSCPKCSAHFIFIRVESFHRRLYKRRTSLFVK